MNHVHYYIIWINWSAVVILLLGIYSLRAKSPLELGRCCFPLSYVDLFFFLSLRRRVSSPVCFGWFNPLGLASWVFPARFNAENHSFAWVRGWKPSYLVVMRVDSVRRTGGPLQKSTIRAPRLPWEIGRDAFSSLISKNIYFFIYRLIWLKLSMEIRADA